MKKAIKKSILTMSSLLLAASSVAATILMLTKNDINYENKNDQLNDNLRTINNAGCKALSNSAISNDLLAYASRSHYQIWNTNQIVAGHANVTENDSLSLKNIVSQSNLDSHKAVMNNNELKMTWKWNPNLSMNNNVNTGKAKAVMTPWYFASQFFGFETAGVSKDKLLEITENVLKFPDLPDGTSPISMSTSFVTPQIEDVVEPEKYQNLVKFIELSGKYDHVAKKELDKWSEEDYTLRQQIDDLGFIYLIVESRIPVEYFITHKELTKLYSDQTIIDAGQRQNGNYRYFIKYGFKTKPLNIKDLSKYVRVNFSSTNLSDANDEYANKSLVVDFDTRKMKIDLAGMNEVNMSYWPLKSNLMNEFFAVSKKVFWSEIQKIIKEKTSVDFKIYSSSFEYVNDDHVNVIKVDNNWVYSNQWVYETNGTGSTLDDLQLKSLQFKANITVTYKPVQLNEIIQKLKVANKKGVEEQEYLAAKLELAKEINANLLSLRSQVNKINKDLTDAIYGATNSLKDAQNKIQTLIKNELEKNPELKVKFDSINKTFDEQFAQKIKQVENEYEIYKNDKTFKKDNFMTSSNNKVFSYEDDLHELKNLLEQKVNSIDNLINGTELINLRDQIKAITSPISSKLNNLKTWLIEIEKKIPEYVTQNAGLLSEISKIDYLNVIDNYKIDLLSNNSYLANNADDQYWFTDSNKHYQNAVDKKEFINALNKFVNDKLASIIGKNIAITEELFKIDPTKEIIEIEQGHALGKDIVINLTYKLDTNKKKFTKLELNVNLKYQEAVNLSSNNEGFVILQVMKNYINNNFELATNLLKDINSYNEQINEHFNEITNLNNANLTTVFSEKNRINKINEHLAKYSDLTYSKTRFNTEFFVVVVIGGLVVLLSLIGLIIYLSSFKRHKTYELTQEEKEWAEDMLKEREKNN